MSRQLVVSVAVMSKTCGLVVFYYYLLCPGPLLQVYDAVQIADSKWIASACCVF